MNTLRRARTSRIFSEHCFFTKQESGVEVSLNCLWRDARHRLYAVGNQGTILRSADGERWRSVESGTREDLEGICGTPRALYAVGGDGTLLRGEAGGKAWSRERRLTKETLWKIQLSRRGELYAVGDGGTLLALEEKTP